MTTDEIISRLVQERDLLDRYGVASLKLFGSTARGGATASSDVDLLVEFKRPVGLFGLIELQQRLEDAFGCAVDLGTAGSLKPRIRDRVLAEAIDVTPPVDRAH